MDTNMRESHETVAPPSNSNVQVVVRVRPLNSREKQLENAKCTEVDRLKNSLTMTPFSKGFTFDFVADEDVMQVRLHGKSLLVPLRLIVIFRPFLTFVLKFYSIIDTLFHWSKRHQPFPYICCIQILNLLPHLKIANILRRDSNQISLHLKMTDYGCQYRRRSSLQWGNRSRTSACTVTTAAF